MEPGKSAEIAAKKIREKYKKLRSKKKPETTTITDKKSFNTKTRKDCN